MGALVLGNTSQASSDQQNVTSPPVDTTGSNFISVSSSNYNLNAVSLSDNLANVWTLDITQASSQQTTNIWSCHNPTVGAGHTFTLTGVGTPSYCTISVVWASGISNIAVQSTNSVGSVAPSIQPGSVTPAENGDLIITSNCSWSSTSGSIDSGFSSNYVPFNTSNSNLAGGMGWLIQPTAAAINPTWTFSGSVPCAAAIAVYKATQIATSYTLVAPSPSTGKPGTVSSNFTLTPNGPFTGTITLHDASAGGTFTPSSLTWSGDASAKTFTYTAASVGAKTISSTNSDSLTDPSSVTFTAYALTLIPASQSVANGAAANLTATLTGGSGSLSANSVGGTLSTSTPTSGVPFTLTVSGTGSGTDLVNVSGPGGTTASAAVSYPIPPGQPGSLMMMGVGN